MNIPNFISDSYAFIRYLNSGDETFRIGRAYFSSDEADALIPGKDNIVVAFESAKRAKEFLACHAEDQSFKDQIYLLGQKGLSLHDHLKEVTQALDDYVTLVLPKRDKIAVKNCA